MVEIKQRWQSAALWLKLLAAFGVVVLAAAVTIIVMALISNNKTSPVDTSENILTKFSKQVAPTLGNVGYDKTDAPYSTYLLVNYQEPYNLYLPAVAGQYLKFQNIHLKHNSAATTGAIESFLKTEGLDLKTTTKLSGISQELFSNAKALCQLSDIDAISDQPAAYVLACLDRTVVDAQYKKIDGLLTKSKADLSQNLVKTVASQEIDQAKQQLLVLITTNQDKSSSSLYYLESNGDITYIGMRPTPSVDDENSYAIPAKLRQAIDASPAKAFLNQYIR